jgi:L-alanine-DL-glutamate epimerase-like enolase superfamily enzyme
MKENEIKVEIEEISVPFKRTFETALRKADKSHSLVIKVVDGDLTGFGESYPSLVITGESTETVKRIIPVLTNQITGNSFENLTDFIILLKNIEDCVAGNTSLKCGLTSALVDLYTKEHQIKCYSRPLETDITLPIGQKEIILNEIERYLHEGFSSFKIKIGKDLKKDTDLIKSIRKRFGYEPSLRLDANQGYTRNEAQKAIDAVYRYEIELMEQPVPAWDLEGMDALRGEIPIMADESLFNSHNALELVDKVDFFNIKLNKSGGVLEGLRIANIAKVNGIECMVGCMGGETMVGITADAIFASFIDAAKADLDSPLLLEYNPVKGGVEYVKNQIFPPRGYGFGIEDINHDK